MNFIKRNKKVAAIVVAAVAVPLSVTAVAGAQDGPDREATFEVEFAESTAAHEECQLRLGLVDADGVPVAETSESREAMYSCLAEAWPDWYEANPTPLAPPTDWQPDASQLAEQAAFTGYLSEMLTEEGIEHTVVTDTNGAEWVDYDEFDPEASSGVGEIIARGDHFDLTSQQVESTPIGG